MGNRSSLAAATPAAPDAGRKSRVERCAFPGILPILPSGLRWEMLPKERQCGFGITGGRRARGWQKTGVLGRWHRVLLTKLRDADQLDFSRMSADRSSVRALGGK